MRQRFLPFNNCTIFFLKTLAITLFASLFSCEGNFFKEKKQPLAEAGGKYLYEEDIQNIFHTEMSQGDSLSMIESYVRSWATDILLYEKAQENIRNEAEIEALIENYRRSLLIYEYQLQMIKERLNNKISSDEILSYYNENPQLFKMREILIKGLFLVIPNQAPDMNELRTLANVPNDEKLDKIESLSVKNAAKFEYFNEKWIPFTEIQRKSPIRIENAEILKHRSFFESKDSSSTFFLFVQEYIPEGEIQPLEYAEPRIKEIILEQRKNNYLKEFGNKLYEDGIRAGKVKRHY